jgi:hypothetical protein
MIGRSLCSVERLCGHLSFRRSLSSASRTSRKNLGRRGTIRLFNFAQTPPARSCLICTTPDVLNDPQCADARCRAPADSTGRGLFPGAVVHREAHVGSTHVGFCTGRPKPFSEWHVPIARASGPCSGRTSPARESVGTPHAEMPVCGPTRSWTVDPRDAA